MHLECMHTSETCVSHCLCVSPSAVLADAALVVSARRWPQQIRAVLANATGVTCSSNARWGFGVTCGVIFDVFVNQRPSVGISKLRGAGRAVSDALP